MQQHRHLAAILFTDIVGYTALMQENEQKAVALIKHYDGALNEIVGIHNGKVLNYYGDGSLCTFPSVIEALNCALELQMELQAEPNVPLRIGLHVGEVFFENEKALGDGVNVASRIQSLGQANTILFSKEIADKIRNQLEFKSVSLGLFEFKNVDQPMEVFALANEGLNVPQKKAMTGKLKETEKKFFEKKLIIIAVIALLLIAAAFAYNKLQHSSKFTGKEKSVAVLPFNNMSSDKENEYFSDGMTEEITTQLSKIADLKVIARTSSMLYKGSKKSIKQIADELGVFAILEGSVQKDGDKIRITAQLVDANTQEHIWAEKYDRDFKDVFAIQSEVAQQIVYQLNVNLTKDEKKRIDKRATENLEAYKYYLQGMNIHEKFFETYKLEYYTNSKSLFEKVLSLDSNYALAHAALADLYNTYTNYIKKDSALLALQINEIEKAYSIDSTLDYINFTMGTILASTLEKPEEAYKYFKRALQINPNNTDNLFGAASSLRTFGLYDESVVLMNKAVKLDPLKPSNFRYLAMNEVSSYRLNDAIRNYQTALQLEPDYYDAISGLIYVYSLQNKLDSAGMLIEKESRLRLADSPPPLAVAFYYAKLGNKKKALEIHKNLRLYLSLGMKEEALQQIKIALKNLSNPQQPQVSNNYLAYKNNSQDKDFDIIRNDSLFLEWMEKNRQHYEINKKKFSIVGLLNQHPSSTP